jgi:type II secretory pathway pseudopilin PulG
MQAPGLAALKRWTRGTRRDRGAVLLEVLLALGLFVFAAAVVSSGLNAAVDRTLRLRAQTHALDLAVSVLSELELGLRPAVAGGPEPFDPPFEQWTWELEAVPQSFGTDDLSGLQQVTVIVRGGEPPAVQRLATIVNVGGGPAEVGTSGEEVAP